MEAMRAAEKAADAVFQAVEEQAKAACASAEKQAVAESFEGSKQGDEVFKRALAEAVAHAHDERNRALAEVRAKRDAATQEARSTRDATIATAKHALETARDRVKRAWAAYTAANQTAVTGNAEASGVSEQTLAEFVQVKDGCKIA